MNRRDLLKLPSFAVFLPLTTAANLTIDRDGEIRAILIYEEATEIWLAARYGVTL